MKMLCILTTIFAFSLIHPVTAEPTDSRSWTSTSGSTVEGKVLSIEAGKANLERADGPVVQVPLELFVEEDRAILEKHFKVEAPKPGEAAASSATPAEGLPYEQGTIFGPIDTGNNATYHLYLPKSLKKDRKAPLLFYTDSQGGKNPHYLKKIIEGAELCGWIMAMSVESKNNTEKGHNVIVSKASVKHLLETLPINEDRIYFTGNSGGGATAMANASEIHCGGAMPNVGYIPQGYNPNRKGHYYVLGGGSDYNRYLSAYIGEKFGDNAVHRMHPGGHGPSLMWQYIDGMIWLNMQFLAANRGDHTDEAMDFEATLIAWINKEKAERPDRAYSTARLLKEDYKISGANAKLVDALISELGTTPSNVQYHEGLVAIDKFSEKKMAGYGEGGGSKRNHTAKEVARGAEKLQEEFAASQFIIDTLKAIASPTK